MKIRQLAPRRPLPWWLRYLTPLGGVVLVAHLMLLLVTIVLLLIHLQR